MQTKKIFPDDENGPGCPACCLYFLNFLESYLGLSLIKSNCPHTDPKLTRCEFTYAKNRKLNIFCTIIMLIVYCTENLNFLRMLTSGQGFTLLAMRSLFCVYGVGAAYWYNLLRLKFQRSMLISVDSYINDDIYKELGQHIFTKKQERQIYEASRRHTIVYFTLLSSFIIGEILQTQATEGTVQRRHGVVYTCSRINNENPVRFSY